MKHYRIGYTQGVFDMFHVGHLNLLNHAKAYCDYLIVGVNSDKLVESYKGKAPVINQKDRRLIVTNIKCVDETVIAETLDKVIQWEALKFEAVFIGDDWKGNARWVQTEIDLKEKGVDTVFIPYTRGICSTKLREEFLCRVDG